MTVHEQAVRQVLDGYARALGAGDADALAAHWDVPALVLSDEGAHAVGAIAEVVAFFAGATEWYRAQGIMGTRPELLKLEALGQRLVSVGVRWLNLDAAGAEMGSESSRYILHAGDDSRPRIRVAVALGSLEGRAPCTTATMPSATAPPGTRWRPMPVKLPQPLTV